MLESIKIVILVDICRNNDSEYFDDDHHTDDYDSCNYNHDSGSSLCSESTLLHYILVSEHL